MRIDKLLTEGITRSFEFFPPKSDDEATTLRQTIDDLFAWAPSFVSVTYRGAVESRERTFQLVTAIEGEGRTSAMAHLICVGHTRNEVRDVLTRYQAAGVENLMALGGDPEPGSEGRTEFAQALDLVEFAREVGDFAIGVGAHPAGHPRSSDLESDRRYLAEKLRAADFAVTQFFFEAHQWRRLVEDLADLKVTKPVIAGIMPVTTLASLDRMSHMGASVPEWLVRRLEDAQRRGGPSEVREEGIGAATELCRELLELGVPGLHFYTLNRSTATVDIVRRLT